MAKAQKTISVRLEPDDYEFLSRLADAEKEDVSTAVRNLIARGRVMLAVDRYREGAISLGRAAELAGISVGEMMDLLAKQGVPSNLDVEDYRAGLRALQKVW